MDSELTALSQKLLRAADQGLIDLQLDLLSERVTDEDVRDVLSALHAAGEGDTLRDVLAEDRLARWAAETCTAREEDALARQLRKWLGRGAVSGDDPERLVAVDAPPDDRAGLFAWANEHGIGSALLRPAYEVLPELPELPVTASVADLCLGESTLHRRGGSLLGAQRAEDEAFAFLRALAAKQRALSTREALHRSPLPEGRLGLLARRLRAYASQHDLRDLHELRFVPARPVTFDGERGRGQGALLVDPNQAPAQVTLFLSAYEQRALEGTCTLCGTHCVHLDALAARLLDACLWPEDHLHAALKTFSEHPSWQRFMKALAPEARTTDLSFALRIEAGRASVAALTRRTRDGGRPSAGKLASPHKLARTASLDDRDREVLRALAAGTRTLTPQYVAADVALLRSLVEHPGLVLDDGVTPLSIREETLHVDMLEQPEGLSIQASLAGAVVARGNHQHYVLHHDVGAQRLSFAALTPALERLLAALVDFRGVLPPESYPQLASWLGTLKKSAHVTMPKLLAAMERPAPERLLLRITPLLEEGVDVSLTVRALPLAPLYAPGRGPELVHGLIDGTACTVRRELTHERVLAEQLLDGLVLRDQMELTPFRFRIDSTQGALELLSRAAALQDKLEIEWAERARSLRISDTVTRGDLRISLFKRGDWCALSGGVQRGELKVAFERLLEAARTGERFVPIEGGDYLEIEQSLFERLGQAQLVMPALGRCALPAVALRAWDDALGLQSEAGDPITARFMARARADAACSVPLRSSLSVELREYQRRGVAWLLARSAWAPGVCLADEMGLGKTVQSIALLAERGTLGPALVLAPTSVVDNWMAELSRCAPQLDARRYRGAEREALLNDLGPNGVLVTSYELLLRDVPRFQTLQFSTLVLDEAQVLKNARTLRARAVKSLHADFRLALSGTPLENRLGDLWSLFYLLAPELLGSWQAFRARFAVPIERFEKEDRARALRQLVSPFLLRRTKREVARELPPRTEVVHLIELSPAEHDLYQAALAHARTALGKRKRSDEGRAVQILAELTRLRQLACHPRLVLQDSRVSSSKLASLILLLQDLLPRGHRMLVFSQFVRHLELVREELDKLGVRVLQLDGSTPAAERAALVAAFQRGEAELFLISLKAGGTGLNLTAADYVVHLDPWWNPAAEDQASDRAHRIGQQRPVTVIKLVAQDTIEERVLGLHEHKRRLSGLVLDEADAAATPELALSQLEALLGAEAGA